MKIKDLSFITKIDQENTNNVNGGISDPFANVGNTQFIDQAFAFNDLVFSGASQNEINSFLFEQSINNSLAAYDINTTIEPTVFSGSFF
jgi:hypothetical protein